MKLTKAEKNAINALKNVAEIWPDSLWLLSASGDLKIMKKKGDQRATVYSSGSNGYDQSFIVDQIKIENDGGDW